MTYPTIGTISHNTLRPQDILPAMLDALRDIANSDHPEAATASAQYAQIVVLLPAHAMEDDDAQWWGEDAHHIICDLENVLNDYAPPYCYFGCHGGNGSDIGYWPDLSAIDMAIHDGDLVKHDETIEDRETLVISDHGNMTLYSADGTEIWSII